MKELPLSFFKSPYNNCGRSSGLVTSALDSRSKGPGQALAGVIGLCASTRHFTLTVPLSIQENKLVPANCWGNLTKCWVVTCDGLASHPGGIAILLVASCYGNRYKLRLCADLYTNWLLTEATKATPNREFLTLQSNKSTPFKRINGNCHIGIPSLDMNCDDHVVQNVTDSWK